MDWAEEGRKRASARLQSLVDSAPSLSIPIKEKADDAAGWGFLGETYTCIPDAVHPWDPDVLRAIRTFCPDAVPISIRSVWRSSRVDGEQREMVVVRHGIARYIRDPIAPVHHFYCQMPSTPVPGSPRLWKPNYIELNWYDKEVRPWGYDLPGEYLPFDWELYQSLYMSKVTGLDADGMIDRLVTPYVARRERRKRQAAEERAYIDNDVQKYTSKLVEHASDLERKEAVEMAGLPPVYEPKPTVVVPSTFTSN